MPTAIPQTFALYTCQEGGTVRPLAMPLATAWSLERRFANGLGGQVAVPLLE